MLLKDLMNDTLRGTIPPAYRETDITAVCTDSRRAVPGSLFVALQGASGHGSSYAAEAVARGARVVVSDRKTSHAAGEGKAWTLAVDDTRAFLTDVLRRFYGDPGRRLKTIGVTGTNGKTTITYLLESVFRHAGLKSGVIGTIGHRVGPATYPAQNTTPGIVDNFRYLSEMAEGGTDFCMMEVSSHALHQHRVAGIDFYAALFTNLTGDHLDYHKDEEEYFLVKARLFEGLSPGRVAVINVDDVYGQRLVRMTPSKIVTYGIQQKADLTAKAITPGLDRTTLTLTGFGKEILLETRLFGRHNVYNILAVAGFCLAEGIPEECLQQGVKNVGTVPGRMELVPSHRDFHVFIDYAHTQDALKNILAGIRDVTPGRTILVFGCGGDRDRTKRPKMGRTASRLADFTVITNDNPRGERPEDIAEQIAAGFENRNYKILLDRKQAIGEALQLAGKGDIVLIAGKGHEGYQIFKDKRIPFDEKQIVTEILSSL